MSTWILNPDPYPGVRNRKMWKSYLATFYRIKIYQPGNRASGKISALEILYR
jgi:hypothetical protein